MGPRNTSGVLKIKIQWDLLLGTLGSPYSPLIAIGVWTYCPLYPPLFLTFLQHKCVIWRTNHQILAIGPKIYRSYWIIWYLQKARFWRGKGLQQPGEPGAAVVREQYRCTETISPFLHPLKNTIWSKLKVLVYLILKFKSYILTIT